MEIRIALAGNPNCGKTTLFNALTGSNQFVGNWPGVTVEKKEGKLKNRDDVIITDLPGIYSLSPYTLEEVVARKYLVGERPDAILNIVDGTVLERNLYLTTQLTELGIPVVIAINMMDVVRKNGDRIDTELLSKEIGCPIVEISALKNDNIFIAVDKAIEMASGGKTEPTHDFSGTVEHAIAHIEEAVLHDMDEDKQRWYAIKIFERDQQVIESLKISKEKLDHIEKDISTVEKRFDDDAESIITNERYNYIASVTKNCYFKKNANGQSITEKIDKVVTNRILALPIFAVIMFLVYFISVSVVGNWANVWANDGLFGDGFYFFGKWVNGIPVVVSGWLESVNCAPWLQSLIVDGIIAGVGAVLGFVPQIFVLFIILSFLEACGYMSRIAFMLDRIFRKFGLSGKSFIPMLVGTGCGVPGIMASRTIENESDRKMTVITTTFIPCGAKLPIVAMISSSFFGGSWWVAPSVYFLGVFAIISSGVILKKTKIFSSQNTPFIMELPSYHMPTVKNLFKNVWDRTWAFIKKAGTIILLSTIFIWIASRLGNTGGKFGFSLDMQLEKSVLGYFGLGLGWLFKPLGFGDSATTIATFMGLLAKEEVVAVLGVLDSVSMTSFGGYSFLAFNLLCAPCVAAMGAIRREMNDARWTAFAILYQCSFAYFVSLVINQFGLALSGNINIFGFIVAIILLAFFSFMLFRPAKKKV